MFSKSVSPSWTYVAIVRKLGGGHEMKSFTLPSNQTRYQNNNEDALLYYCNNLNFTNMVEGCVASEDYDPLPMRVGISHILAHKLELERQQKFDNLYSKTVENMHSYSGVDYAKENNKSFWKEFIDNIDKDEDEDEIEDNDDFDKLFDDIFNSPEFQKKYEALIQTFVLDVVKSMLHKEIDKVLSVEYIKKNDL